MKIFITGATGFIAKQLIPVLLEQKHELTLFTRRKISFSTTVKYCYGNFAQMQNPEDWIELLQEQDIVINLVGIIKENKKASFEILHYQAPVALFKAAKRAGIQKVIQISALGAGQQASTLYYQTKGRADHCLQNLGIDYLILRPSLVLGQGGKSLGLFSALALFPRLFCIGDGKQLIQPVYINDLIRTIEIALTHQQSLILNVVGKNPIEFQQLLMGLRQNFGSSKQNPFYLPLWLTKLLPSLGFIMAEPMINKASLLMLAEGNHASSQPLTEYLERPPLTWQDTLTQLSLSKADKLQAQFYFIKPILRWSLAFLWFWTALVSVFIFDKNTSFEYLAALGISGPFAPLALYGSALLDFSVAMLLIFRWRPKVLMQLQIAIILSYSVLIAIFLPEFLIHPFGALTKNLIVLWAVYILFLLEEPL